MATHSNAVTDSVAFIHIPKTGGSTLRWVLDRQYASFLYLIPQWFDENYREPLAAAKACQGAPQALGAHRCFDGSWPLGQAMAMVRDPVRRVISHVAHLKAEPLAWMPEIPAEMKLSLADWCERSPLALFDNNQVRYLSGAQEFDGMPLTRAMDESDLELALEAVRSRVLVAPMESFDEALLDWGYRLGWDTPYYRRVNVRRGTKPELPARDLQALESWNRLDRVLCEEVGVLFRARLAELEQVTGRSMEDQLKSFRKDNESLAAKTRILWHTLQRGLRHPVRAANMVARTVRQRSGR